MTKANMTSEPVPLDRWKATFVALFVLVIVAAVFVGALVLVLTSVGAAASGDLWAAISFYGYVAIALGLPVVCLVRGSRAHALGNYRQRGWAKGLLIGAIPIALGWAFVAYEVGIVTH